jgi:hypothetical protein
MKTILQSIFLIFILAGCNELINEQVSLTPYENWRSYNIHDYTVEQVRSCYCVNGGQRMKITVRSDTVYSVMRLSDFTLIPYPTSKQYLTIDSLFGIIQYSKTDSLVFTYDPKYGFPDRLDINPQLHPVDGGVLFETSNLQPMKYLLSHLDIPGKLNDQPQSTK